MRRRILYTANYGGYDTVPALPNVVRDSVDAAYCFTDRPDMAGDGWQCCVYGDTDWEELPDVAKAKALKIMPWRVFEDDWDECVWSDGRVQWLGAPPLSTDPFKTLHHPQTDSLYKEFRLWRVGKHPYHKNADIRARMDAQQDAYSAAGVPDMDGCGCRTSVLMRQNTDETRRLCDAWWDVFMEWRTWSDQLALRKAVHDTGIPIALVRKDATVNKWKTGWPEWPFRIGNHNHRAHGISMLGMLGDQPMRQGPHRRNVFVRG